MRPLAAGDEGLYVGLYTNAEVMRHIGPPQDAATAARGFGLALQFNAASPPERLFWVIHDRAQTGDLGLLGLTLDAAGAAEVGVVLPPAHQGRGFATEAIAAVADYAFDTIGLQRLHTRHDPGHGLAAGLMATLGFERSAPDAGRSPWRWQLTPARWAASARRQATANPLR